MKILRITPLVSAGKYPRSAARSRAEQDLKLAINAITWPPGADKFTIYPEPGKARGKGNGVKLIKDTFVRALLVAGWRMEKSYPRGKDVDRLLDPGAFDAWLDLGQSGVIAAEWETGNISSSHRAMNKMALALLEGHISAGYLILPSRSLYVYLTDRIGNYRELEPYFSLWGRLPVQDGLLAVIEVEHDATSKDVPKIPKGTDGRALA